MAALGLAGCRRISANYATAQSNIWLQINRGELDAALKEVNQMLALATDERSEWHWRFWSLKGEILMREGLYRESLSFLDAPLPPAFASSDIAVWQKLTQTAACARISRFADAEKLLTGAELLAHSKYPKLLGEAALRRGTLAFYSGNPEAAISSYRTALKVAREQNDRFLEAAALGSLGFAFTRLELYDQAIDWNKQALELALSFKAMSSVARIEGNTGWNYLELGDLESALAEFKDAERVSRNAGLAGDRVYWLNSAAGVYYGLGDYAAAQSSSTEAIALAKKLKDDATTIECLQLLATISLAKHQFNEAQQYLREATLLEGPSPYHPRESSTLLLEAHLAASTHDFIKAEKSYSAIAHDSGAPTSIRWEAEAGLAQVYAEQGKPALAERGFQAAIGTISKARDALQHEDYRLSFLSSAIRFYGSYVNFLVDQNRPVDALRIADQSRAQTLEQGLAPSANHKPLQVPVFKPQALARRLNATLLLYWLGEQRSYLWAVSPQKISLFPLSPSAEIDAAVKAFRQSFLDPRDPLEDENSEGRKLYSALIAPVGKIVSQNSRVVILPDGSLNSLNFETLVVPAEKPSQKPHYWIEDATVITANSLALLSRTSLAAPPKQGHLLVVGDALAANADFPPLPQAGKELRLLENYFAPAQRLELTGPNATATKFLSNRPEEFSYLHFAAHGTASRLRPLESAVILSPDGESYKLYAHDVMKRPLNAYLVTISACNGAGIKSYAGEGLVGLSWAFLRAGAHNVIAGLWEVSNASTPQLMDELYKGLHAGEEPATALRKAKLTLVHSNGNYRKPFYWAPFLLYAGS
ncbi:MAG TPA: CHAT domain-containing protein [Candidatus Acidoferrum sp.]